MLSLGGKEKKNLKKIAASVSSKVEKVGAKAKKSVSSLKLVSRGNMVSMILLLFRIKIEVDWTPCQKHSNRVEDRLITLEEGSRMKTLESTQKIRMTCSRYE